jgi:hypothetical protein
MRANSFQTWAPAFGLVLASGAAMAADITPPPSEPLPDAFTISPSAGVMNFDLPDIKANAIAVNSANQSIDLKPDLDRLAPVVGGSFAARLGELGQSTVRLRGSGFYAWVDSNNTVELDGFGALAWKGLTDGSPTVSMTADVNAATAPPSAAATATTVGAITAATFAASAANSPPPTATAEAGDFSEAGSAYALAGNLDGFGTAIHYDEDLAYWGGELALAFGNGSSESGVTFSPFIGPIVRGIDRDLETTLTESVSSSSFSLHESLDGRYYGAVIGVDAVVPAYNGVAVDFSVSGAPLYLDADYEGQEANSSSFQTTIKGPKIDDSEGRLAGLLRAQAGLNFPVLGHSWIRVGGEVEYLTDAPTIERDIGRAAVAANDTTASAVSSAAGGAKLAKLGFDDMFAYGFNASLTIPFGP